MKSFEKPDHVQFGNLCELRKHHPDSVPPIVSLEAPYMKASKLVLNDIEVVSPFGEG
jgi:hypothetical protein